MYVLYSYLKVFSQPFLVWMFMKCKFKVECIFMQFKDLYYK